MNKDIDRPLGLDDGRRKRWSLGRPGASGLVLILAALLVGGASAAIAFRDQPFRTPPVAAVSRPEAAPPAPEQAVAGLPAAKAEHPSGGPSIIRVEPEESDGEAGNDSIIVIRDPSALGQERRMAHLPDRALIEPSEMGPLPVRGADGRRPMDVYARQWSGARGARVAIVIGGLGLSQTGTQEALAKLPPEVTLAFAPQGNSLDRWMQAARRDGHEIVMQTPLEPFDYPAVDPGRNTLTVAASAEENLDRLRWTLSRITNYTGVMNYMGGRFVTDPAAMTPLMQELGERGLLYLDDGSSARSVAAEIALANRVPYAEGDAAIDLERERGAILGKLDELERIARAEGSAIGTGSAFDVTVDAVASWVREARKRGIEIVPVSALVTDPERS